MTAPCVLYQTGSDPYNSNYEDPEGRIAFTIPNLVVRLTREALWASQHPTIMGPERSYFYFGPQVTAGYVMYGNNHITLPMSHLCRLQTPGSNSRYFTAQSGRVYKWRISPQRMECIDGKQCLAVWELLPSPESDYQARVTLSPAAMGLVTEIMTTLILNRMYIWSRW
ncbi:hypothetical protein L218DRAFT_971514 [Marasmius fiardii PR-910]|nr:hypothetical protein L218DRAFT_971514 [Marasmius fiardii PR-910]